MEAYEFLQERLNLRQGLPYTPKWSAGPDFLRIIVDHCLEAKPATILECGSGMTTLMLARCCQLDARGRVYSLEDGGEYAERTRGYLDRYGLGEYASVIHAPLEKMSVGEVEYLWYGMNKIPDWGIEMLVIDGPSGFIQSHSRYPALPLLFSRLSDRCVVFLDDAARADEKEIVESWKAAYPQIEHDYIETQRGCSVLILDKG